MPTNVPITQDTANPYSESDISIDFSNPQRIIAGSNANFGSVQAQYWSNDGGATWNQSSLPAVAGDNFQSDPAVGWTTDGTAWALTIAVKGATLVVRSFKSTDGGKTWTFDSVVSGAQTFTDKPLLWVDRSSSSPFQDNMYAVWHLGAQCFVATRPGPGGTWQTPVQTSGAETTFTADGGDVKTNAFGDVFAFWPDAGGQTLRVAKSSNGGSTFTALAGGPIKIANTFGSFTIKVPAQAARLASGGSTIGTLIYVTGGAYRTATQNLVFACWHDLAGGAGCNAEADQPIGNVASPCKTRIWFARSLDGGATWGPAQKLNDQPSRNDQFFPRLAVDDVTGNLLVIYYDTVNDPGRLKTDIWMQVSTDGGATWTNATQVTTAETDEAVGEEDNQQEYGDYIGVTGYGGNFFACWTDRRGGSFEQIWGAGFTVKDLVTAIPNSGNFGQVCIGSFADELLTIDNAGSSPLSIFNITSSSPDFLPPGVLSYPIVVAPGASVDVVIRFEPLSPPGPKSGTITIFSSDAAGPHKITVSGRANTSRLSLAIADSGKFGNVCVGSFRDELLILNNSGKCAVTMTSITSSSTEFLVAEVLSYPLSVGAGDTLPIPIRFEPTSAGVKSATLTVVSSDPASPHKISISGDGQTSRLSLVMADTGHFGKVCVGAFSDQPLILSNSSSCALSVISISSSSAEFLVPEVLSYPLVIAAGSFLPAPIRFKPDTFGSKSAKITVISSDPASPHTVVLGGEAPSGRITVTGSTRFGGVKCCHREQRTLAVCNTGDCSLRVHSVKFKHKRRCYRLINDPFPATVRPGSCLSFVIEYKAMERVARGCDLVIHSDDPHEPEKYVEIAAYTIWDCCKCCEEAPKCGCGCGCHDQPKGCDDDEDAGEEE